MTPNHSLCLSFVQAHGTFIGNIRLEAHKPTQLPTDSTFHFGASTRFYTIREKPKNKLEQGEGDQLALPDDEIELDVS